MASFAYPGRGAWAGSCTVTSSTTATCSGAADPSDVAVGLANPAGAMFVTTEPGFGLNVTSLDDSAIYLFQNAGFVSFVDLNGSTIRGRESGIYHNDGGGGLPGAGLEIVSTGQIVGETGYGIRSEWLNVRGASVQGTVSIGVADVYGAAAGIWVYSRSLTPKNSAGRGTYITATGDVLSAGTGIDLNATYGKVNVGDVMGGRTGIRAVGRDILNVGTGDYRYGYSRITATGHVQGDAEDGIVVRAWETAIDVATVAGGRHGIDVETSGGTAFPESVSVTATGAVTGTTGFGVRTTGVGVKVEVAETSGGAGGIYARGQDVSLTSHGQVEGGAGHGIDAQAGGAGLRISAAGVHGGAGGIVAKKTGTEAQTITVTGEVRGDAGVGIYARNAGGGALEITAGAVTGGGAEGIAALNYGAGMSVSAWDVTGATHGVRSFNYGTGGLSVTLTGVARGTSGYGVFARSNAGDAVVEVGGAAGAVNGLDLRGFGAGVVRATASGDVSGGSGYGVFAYGGGYTTGMEISTAGVTGGSDGISARHMGGGTLRIAASGAVQGGTGAGIRTYTRAGGAVAIELAAGASVGAASGAAIVDADGDATVEVRSGASVAGRIQLGEGDDALVFDGGDASGVTRFDGGGGSADRLAFRDTTGTVDAGLVVGFEAVDVEAGALLEMFGRLNATLGVASGGTLAPGASPGLLEVDGDMHIAAGGLLEFELGGLVGGVDYDAIDVTGAATFDGGAILNVKLAAGFRPARGTSFDVLYAGDIFVDALEDIVIAAEGLPSSFWGLDLIDGAEGDVLRLTLVQTPVPASALLFGSAIAAMGWLGAGRRRRAPDGARERTSA
ncbi:hypothetical protein P2H44_19870 [Albimonas sp. CAU 1670]|uniref:beta strand repeat-containing protein n=1 Tax=Albimonas sp. CAU 1670 TaxID=3032599 RepID=UPI0023DA31AD|nr:hypothetical protein [Albimonas sp. CAU 1670]MDF2234825.1 hypothetical protein [Albimonas sp. CAU 1670]